MKGEKMKGYQAVKEEDIYEPSDPSLDGKKTARQLAAEIMFATGGKIKALKAVGLKERPPTARTSRYSCKLHLSLVKAAKKLGIDVSYNSPYAVVDTVLERSPLLGSKPRRCLVSVYGNRALCWIEHNLEKGQPLYKGKKRLRKAECIEYHTAMNIFTKIERLRQ